VSHTCPAHLPSKLCGAGSCAALGNLGKHGGTGGYAKRPESPLPQVSQSPKIWDAPVVHVISKAKPEKSLKTVFVNRVYKGALRPAWRRSKYVLPHGGAAQSAAEEPIRSNAEGMTFKRSTA